MKIFRDLTSSLKNRKKRNGRRGLCTIEWSTDTEPREYYKRMLEIDSLCEELLNQNMELHAENEMNLDLIEKVEEQMGNLKSHMEKVQRKADEMGLARGIEGAFRESLIKVLASGGEWEEVLRRVLGDVLGKVKSKSQEEISSKKVALPENKEKKKNTNQGEENDLKKIEECEVTEEEKNGVESDNVEKIENSEDIKKVSNESSKNTKIEEIKETKEDLKIECDKEKENVEIIEIDEDTKQLIRKGFNLLANKIDQLYNGIHFSINFDKF